MVTVRRIRRLLKTWGRANFVDYPWRTEPNLWLGLATEVLLQRTRATQVVPAFEILRDRFPAPGAVADAPFTAIQDLFTPLGLRWRARYFHDMGRHLDALGVIPANEAALLAVPAVGPYAAAAFRSLHLRRRAVIVDANIVRWLGRVFGFTTDGETRRKPWLIALADRLTPSIGVREYNYALLDLTMTVCGARPRCADCPLSGAGCAHARGVASGSVDHPVLVARRAR